MANGIEKRRFKRMKADLRLNVSSLFNQDNKEIKNLEHKLSDDNLSLSAFIVSETYYVDLVNVPDSKENLEARNVLFIEDTGPVYLEKLFSKMVSE